MDLFFKTVAVFLVVSVFAAIANGYIDCQSQGGTYVRGLFAMECLIKGE